MALGTLVTIGGGPVFAGLLALAALGEAPARAWLVATGMCVLGLALLTADGAGQPGSGATGLLLALGAGLAYAGYRVAARQLIVRGDHSATVMGPAFGLGGFLLVPVLLVPVLLVQPLNWLVGPAGLALAGYLGLLATALAYVLFGRGLVVLPAGPITTLVLAEPLVATVLGITLLDERLTATGAAEQRSSSPAWSCTACPRHGDPATRPAASRRRPDSGRLPAPGQRAPCFGWCACDSCQVLVRAAVMRSFMVWARSSVMRGPRRSPVVSAPGPAI